MRLSYIDSRMALVWVARLKTGRSGVVSEATFLFYIGNDHGTYELDASGFPIFKPPRLEGIWSRFPYLHNGSVPNVAALLTKPRLRPIAFSLKDAGELSRFDPALLGLTNPRSRQKEKFYAWQAKKGKRSKYSVELEGHSNQGHDFHTDMSLAEKQAVIEYLKTL